MLTNARAVALIAASGDRGYSKALAKPGFYGNPWDQSVFDNIMGPR